MMPSLKVSGITLVAVAAATLLSSRARADEPMAVAQTGQPVYDDYGSAAAQEANPIPPYVEGPAVAATSGGYCYVGPHPSDTRVVPGPAFDETQGQHMRPYPPIDLRLFAFRNGCYYFIGDPRDFGYGGQVYSYYGAHPVLDAYGGGWCFMMGGHYHMWGPWSPYFSVVGPWYYWYGPYDPFFWSYWPYYSYYYRSYYPSYYAGGRFYRGGGYRVAPPIQRVPATGWRGSPPSMAGTAPGGPLRGAPPSGAGTAPSGTPWRGTPPSSNATAGTWRAATPPAGSNATAGTWRTPAPTPAATPMRTAPPSTWGAAPGGGWRAPPSSGGWHGGSAPSGGAPFRAAPPSGGGFSAPRFSPGGGGFRGGHRR
jgi:hypothetical protein